MKKSAFPAALLLLGVALSGCPVYDSDDGCFSDHECPSDSRCDARTGSCVLAPVDSNDASCRRPGDCGANETCSRFGTCMAGDCHFSSVGCVHGYECSPDSGRWECTPLGADAGGNGGAPAAGASSSTSGGEPSAGEGGMSTVAGAGG
jgi:hypothetical protein